MEEVIKTYPPDEKYLLTDQSKRSARGIPALIAEGYARREALRDFQKHLRDCLGEVNEMVNHIILAKHKKYIDTEYADQLVERYFVVGRKLYNLKNNWRNFPKNYQSKTQKF